MVVVNWKRRNTTEAGADVYRWAHRSFPSSPLSHVGKLLILHEVIDFLRIQILGPGWDSILAKLNSRIMLFVKFFSFF